LSSNEKMMASESPPILVRAMCWAAVIDVNMMIDWLHCSLLVLIYSTTCTLWSKQHQIDSFLQGKCSIQECMQFFRRKF
jgi:hypothetical protein